MDQRSNDLRRLAASLFLVRRLEHRNAALQAEQVRQPSASELEQSHRLHSIAFGVAVVLAQRQA